MSTPVQSNGRAWVFGDDLNTDMLAPGAYMKFSIPEIAKHTLAAIEPSFSTQVQPGDVVVGGRNFGAGSSREQAVGVLRHLGVAAVVAVSFAGIFYRNAFNLGLPLLVCPRAREIGFGNRVRVDLDAATFYDVTAKLALPYTPIPAHLVEMIRDGGLMPHLEKRFAKSGATLAPKREEA